MTLATLRGGTKKQFINPQSSRAVAISWVAVLVILLLVLFIRMLTHPLLPVLRSLFFSIHISTIVTAYALLLGIMVVGIITILKLKDTDRLERLKNFSMAMPYPAVALLAAGIFIGAILEDLRQALVFPHLQHPCLSERITYF